MFLWTQGESDSRPPDANRMHCHYAMGPRIKINKNFTQSLDIWQIF